jgi:hypothetical protein
MIGKLYVLSLFYIMYEGCHLPSFWLPYAFFFSDVELSIDSGPATSEEPSEFVPTLTIPIEGCGGLDVDSGVLVSSHRCPSARGSSMSVNTAV